MNLLFWIYHGFGFGLISFNIKINYYSTIACWVIRCIVRAWESLGYAYNVSDIEIHIDTHSEESCAILKSNFLSLNSPFFNKKTFVCIRDQHHKTYSILVLTLCAVSSFKTSHNLHCI